MLGRTKVSEGSERYGNRYGGGTVEAGRKPIDVEALLIWAYQAQRVHLATGWAPGFDGGGRSGDGVASAIEADRLGCRVDGGGRWMGYDVDPDAEIVHRIAAGGADWLMPGSVAWWAERGMRPECWPDWRPTCRPVWRGEPGRIVGGRVVSGKLKLLRDANSNVRACAIELDALPLAVVEAGRREYAAWHAGLTEIGRALRLAGLRGYEPTGPAAPAAPWLR